MHKEKWYAALLLRLVQALLVTNVTSNYATLEQTIDRMILIEFVIRTVVTQHLISFIEVNFQK